VRAVGRRNRLLRDDLETIVAEARRLGYYTNLLTSGVGLTAERATALKAAGLEPRPALVPGFHPRDERFLSHTKTFELKSRVAQERSRGRAGRW